MQRRPWAKGGWRVLQVAALLGAAVTVGGTGLAVGYSVLDGRWWNALLLLGQGALFLVFWRWIFLGAATRSYGGEPDPAAALGPDGRPAPDAPTNRIGPWGVVGMVLTVLVLGGLVVGITWAVVETRRSDQTVRRIRTEAVQVARERGLTYTEVREAWLTNIVQSAGEPGDDPYADLLPVDGATTEQVDVDDERQEALILLRPEQAPPCVILRIDADDHLSTLVSDECS